MKTRVREVQSLSLTLRGLALCARIFGVAAALAAENDSIDKLRRDAEQDDTETQFSIGWMYLKGIGVPQDDAEAVQWFRRVAEQGNAQAQHNLAFMYDKGQGVPQDYIAAHTFFNLAGAKGLKDAPKSRDELAAKMTASHIAEAQRRAREWKTIAP